MPKFINLTGQRFGKLIVIERGPTIPKVTMWKCLCDCGKETVVRAGQLGNGRTRSCGCLNRERAHEMGKKVSNYRHGHATDGNNSREYRSWTDAKARCYNPKNKQFYMYGKRGITMVDRWKDDFAAFIENMGPCPPGFTLDRYPDMNGPYAPGNCRWATAKQQSRNTRKNKMLTINGETMCIAEWAERVGLEQVLISHRLAYGWSPERAVFSSVYHTDSFVKKNLK